MGVLAKSSAAAAAAGAGMIVLSRNSFGLIRSPVRAFASTTAPDAVGADPEKSKRRKKKNLFEVAQFLPNWGLGYKLAKSHWRDVSYELTKINLYKDGRHGKAWGIRYKAGSKIGDAPVKMSGVNKPGWKYLTESMKNINSPSMPTQTTTPASEEALH
ncbi:uncharacterized protein LOC120282157 [Dioscorea cayenensis subsp. rotundata]|uniref:Uncharacterized protein LOC120282157 n=1 Tax=Dioscorea cayennensis subsp. rotundata TaxID=55577 RepID=A0AB40D224_DIOCR|nr:uncharacterized protein LOC120282157 [Dioscorea cayenensis subsp. rotundata]